MPRFRESRFLGTVRISGAKFLVPCFVSCSSLHRKQDQRTLRQGGIRV